MCKCECVSGSRCDTILGGLITARCVDARRCLVLAGLADVARRGPGICLVLACPAGSTGGVDARGGLVLAGTALVCPTHMWCVYVYVCVCD